MRLAIRVTSTMCGIDAVIAGALPTGAIRLLGKQEMHQIREGL